MKTLKTLLLVAVVSALTMTNSNAQADASAEATATATILQDLTVTKNQDLDFGVVVPSSTVPTVVTVLPADASVATITSGLGTLISAGDNAGTSSVAKFTVNGSGTTIYTLTLPTDPIQLSNGSETMPCTLTSSALLGVNITLGGLITASVNDEVFVGGVLTVGAGQASGVYTQTFDLEVNYL